ncbi:MAG: hypothetical protein ACI9OF_002869, partial [Saprospiraceae bacterium]
LPSSDGVHYQTIGHHFAHRENQGTYQASPIVKSALITSGWVRHHLWNSLDSQVEVSRMV